jgi:sialate O-acetylesterase
MFEHKRTNSLLSALVAGILFALTLLVSTGAQAAEPTTQPFLHPLFTDNMVLQRGVKDSIWGWTTPGQRVTVTMLGKHAGAVAAADGRWLVKIGPFKVGGPYTMTVRGPQTVSVKNVLVGDVWLCSGQSNMVFGMNMTQHADEEVAHANYPRIRLMTVPRTIAVEPRQTFDGQWQVCTPETIKQGLWSGFTAVGYFFGRELNQQTHIPIGLIQTAWEGTRAQAWASAASLATMQDFQPDLAAYPNLVQAVKAFNQADFDQSVTNWWQQHDAGLANNNGWSALDFDDAAWKTMTVPLHWEPNFLVGVAWLRKEVEAPASWAGKALTLHLGPIDDADTTFFNGVKVGTTDSWDKPRDYPIPAELVKAGRNVITVRLTNKGGPGGIYGAPEQLQLEVAGDAQTTAIPLAGNWKYKIAVDFWKTPIPSPPGTDPNEVSVLNNGMIAPLEPLSIKGVIWYQGESNDYSGYQYRMLLPLLIHDWRAHFAQGDFPFYIVQLANFMGPQQTPVESWSGWAQVREAQMLAAQTVPNSGLAVTIDIGAPDDVHPTNKQEVGRRLALIALANQYGKHLEYSGPRYRAMRVEGKSIRLTFDHLGGGLLAKGNKLTGFAIAGADKQFVWADATVQDKSIVVSSPQVAHPIAVRYDWANNPTGNLYNKAGLPASPFRTDTDAKP